MPQVMLITGASRGIGAATARLAATRGYALCLNYHRQLAAAEALAEEIIRGGGQAIAVQADVADESQVLQLFAQLDRHFGRLDVLVNNAGITRDNLAMRMKDEEWDAVIDTNLRAVFRMSKLVMRGMMKARNGRIINITSVVASAGNPGQANYAAAKAGVPGTSRALARELGSRNITVNCVAPGFIDTDMTRALPEAARDALLGNIALGRLGRPEEIAGAVAFLASPAAAYVTGTTLHVNGGMYMS
jgi:3-oxoacyl-[acyl-carrier protein] reductase